MTHLGKQLVLGQRRSHCILSAALDQTIVIFVPSSERPDGDDEGDDDDDEDEDDDGKHLIN